VVDLPVVPPAAAVAHDAELVALLLRLFHLQYRVITAVVQLT
jgi:hypothetical protein